MNLSDGSGESNTQENLNENAYEEIDEMVLQELIQSQQIANQPVRSTEEDPLRSSTNTDESIQSNLEDYLNPYQPIVQNTEQRIYRELAGRELLVHNSVMQPSVRDNTDIKFLSDVQLDYTNTIQSADFDRTCKVLHYSEIQIDKTSVNGKENDKNLTNTVMLPTQKHFKQKTQYAEIIHL